MTEMKRADHWFSERGQCGYADLELCRKGARVSDATFYGWRAKFDGMEASDAKRLIDLKSENSKLKKLLAEAHLDINALKEVFGAKY
jgi:putative transposase